MRMIHLVGICCVSSAMACRATPGRDAVSRTSAAANSVFTDSLLHRERCEPLPPGVDWRTVCTPKDQGVQLRRAP
jgi:hypothetical protein